MKDDKDNQLLRMMRRVKMLEPTKVMSMEGEPDEWPLVYFDYAAVYYNEYNMDITTFLVNLIEGKIKPLNFPSDFFFLECSS